MLEFGRVYIGSLNPYKKHNEIILNTKSQTRKGSIIYKKRNLTFTYNIKAKLKFLIFLNGVPDVI